MLKRAIATTIQRVSPRLWLELSILRRDHHFEPEYWLLPDLCTRDADAIDIGGNHGQFAYYLAKLSRHVYVFEPNPICIAALQQVKTRNTTIEGVGLSDVGGVARIRFDPNNTGIGTIEPANTLTNNSGIKEIVEATVPVRRLDDFGLSNIAFIKIDVEGHEPSVIRGGLDLIAKSRPSLLIECEIRHNPSAFAELEAMLTPLGYDSCYLHSGQLHPVGSADVPALQAATPGGGRPYINNFLFLPRDRGDTVQALRRRLAATTAAGR